jgi:hypothetical protein
LHQTLENLIADLRTQMSGQLDAEVPYVAEVAVHAHSE